MTDRVVHYVDSTLFGGVEQVVLQLLRGLDRSRWAPLLYCHEGVDVARLLEPAGSAGVECRILPRPQGLRDMPAWRGFIRQLKRDQPRVFHAHLGWPLGCRHGIFGAKLASVPYIVATAHLYVELDGVRWARGKQWAQHSLIDRYIAVSDEVARRFTSELHVPARKVRVVRNGIDTTAATRVLANGGLRAELLEGSPGPLLLTIARLHPQKGHQHLLAAMRELPEATLALAGDGPAREALQSLARDLGIEDRVRFLGHRSDVADLLGTCDVFVLPSLYEGLPLSVLEAMAAGKPIVATSVGGTDEAIADGIDGMLVPPADPVRLAAALRALLRDPSVMTRLGHAARESAQRNFSVEAMVRGVDAVYRSDLDAPQH